MISIYDKTGKEILQVPITKDCVRRHDLMVDNYILVVFELPQYVDFPKGCYILSGGSRYEVMQNVYPEQDNKKRGWKYEIYFEPPEGYLKKYNVFYRKQGVTEVTFSLTTNILAHANIIVDCINYELGGTNWRVKDVPADYQSQTKLISYKGDKLFEACNLIAEAFECEWWTEQNGDLVDLCFGKLEFGTEEVFEVGKVVTSIPRRKGDDSNYGTRFFVYGSTRNLTSDYGQVPQGGTTNHISEVRLRLPDGIPYIDAWDNLADEDVIHQVVFFEDVYPKNTETVTAVETVKRDIEGSSEKFDAYVMTVGSTSFTPDDLIDGETLGCKFESGVLEGWEFELSVSERNFDKKFEIIHQMLGTGDSQIIIPNRNLCPGVGDKFILTGVKLPAGKIKEAEQELLKVGKSWAEMNSKDTDVYDCPTNPVYCAQFEKSYEVGQKVLLADPRFKGGVRSSRIRAYEKKLWNEYEATYTVGDNTAYSRLGSIETNIKDSQYSERIGVNGSGIYLIRSKYDNTQPTDYNAYAAARSEVEFLHKNKSDIAQGLISFMKGVTYGEYAGGLTGFGGFIDGRGHGELRSLQLWEWLNVPELRYNRTEINIGDKWRAPGGGIIESIDTENQIVTLKLEDGEIGTVKNGDICMGIFHSLIDSENETETKDDGRGNRTFAGFYTAYFWVVEVLDKENRQFRYQLRPVSDRHPKQHHPSQAMHFVGYGSFTDKERQTSCYETRTYQRYLVNVNDWEFEKQNIAAQFGDLSNLTIFGLDMTGYSAYLNNIYMTGIIHQLSGDGETESPIPFWKGRWKSGNYAYYDYVTHNGSQWICVNKDGTNTEPKEGAADWIEWVQKGSDGKDGEGFTNAGRWESSKTPYPKGSLVTFARASFLAKKETSVPPVALITSGGKYLKSGSNYILRGKVDKYLNGDDWEMITPPPVDGTPIMWQGDFASHPSSPADGWAYRNTTDGKSYTYRDGAWYVMNEDGIDGIDGKSIDWKGESKQPPANPEENWVYRDTDDGRVYIYNGIGWELMVTDGDDGIDGLSVFITYHDSEDEPAHPTGNGTTGGWHTTATKEVIWISQKVAESISLGVWGSPIRIKGEVGIENGGRWNSSKVPYKKSTLVTFARGAFLAKRTTSAPPVALLKSGSRYLTSGGNYILRGKIEKYINSDDWELLIPPPDDGKDGKTGLQGQIVRTTEWADNYQYRNDGEDITSIRYLDVVTVSENTSQRIFQCLKTHISTTTNRPPNSEYWQEFNNQQPIYTSLLMAANSAIRFMQGQQLLIQDSTGKVVGGLSGKGEGANGIREWWGSPEPTKGKYRVDENGKMIAEDAEVTGKIIATSGEFTGTLKGVTGTFNSLNCVDNQGKVVGSISFGSDGDITFQGGLRHQASNRAFFASDVFVRKSFGARCSTAIVVYGNYAYYYPYGLDDESRRVYVTLSSHTNTSNKTYYRIPLYGTDGHASGCPVDLVIIRATASSDYRYELYSVLKGKRVTVINANDNKNNIYVYSNGYEIQMSGGTIGDWTYFDDFLYPVPPDARVGRGWIPHSFRDSNWA